ncbi:MAG: GTP 3',8-cyclase MoaA [Bacteriovoracia bacterium]
MKSEAILPYFHSSPSPTLVDQSGRLLRYLRLSVTDACNFRCTYCLPNGYKPTREESSLSPIEIENLVRGFADLGFKKVRITGGEPTLRRDLLEIVRRVAGTADLQKIALSTNGSSLARLAAPLRAAGLTHLNVSLDTLDRESFHRLVGADRLPEVLSGIEAALNAGFPWIKMNAVLLREFTPSTLDRFLEWVGHRPVTVRFIELMRTGENGGFFSQQHYSSGELLLELRRRGWTQIPRALDDGPAVEFSHPESQGRVGIIAPYREGFCEQCNRLRVTHTGGLRLCLFGEQDYSLRELLQAPDQREELAAAIRRWVGNKAPRHLLKEEKYGITRNFAGIGG